jgi:hypothetical protein
MTTIGIRIVFFLARIFGLKIKLCDGAPLGCSGQVTQ